MSSDAGFSLGSTPRLYGYTILTPTDISCLWLTNKYEPGWKWSPPGMWCHLARYKLPTFRMNIPRNLCSPPAFAGYLLGLLLYPEDGSNTFPWPKRRWTSTGLHGVSLHTGFADLTAVSMKSNFLWDMTLCIQVDVRRSFRGTFSFWLINSLA
jgi:hypothetical protein